MKCRIIYDSSIPILGTSLKKLKAGPWTDICILVFIPALFTAGKRWRQPVSITGRTDKQNMLYKHNRTLFSLKKE